jgi:hypothetical protein
MTVPRQLSALLPALVLLAMLLPLADGFTDDGFIHIQYARNIITLGEYSFNPGEISFGTSSPLWVMLLAALGSIFGSGDALIWISRVLSWLAGFGAVLVVFTLVRRAKAARVTAVMAACAFAADPWFARWTALSMESSLAVLAVALMCLASLRALDEGRAAALMGVFAALAALVRPEVYLAIPVLLAAALTRARTVDRRAVAIAVGVAAALLVPWFAFAKFYIGGFIPNTAGAKSGGLVISPVAFVAKMEPVVRILLSGQLAAIGGVLVGLLTRSGRARLLDPSLRFMLLWVVSVPVAYVVLDIQILSRYLLLVTPALCVLGWLALEAVVRAWFPARARAVLVGVAALAVAVNAIFYARVVVPPSRAFTYDLTHEMRSIATWLDANAAPDAVVAAADIGYLAFYGNRRVLDLGGLVEPRTGVLRAQYSYEDIIARGLYFGVEGYPTVDYFIDRDLVPDRFDGEDLAGHHLEKVYAVVVRNLGIRKPGPYHYVLYRVTPASGQ